MVSGLDSELSELSSIRGRLHAEGHFVWVGSPDCIALCRDKRRINKWLLDNGFPTVRQSDSVEPLV